MDRRRLAALTLGLLMLGSGSAAAIEVCDAPPRYGLGQAAINIVRATCEEHRLWGRPFFDPQGHVASLGVTEAEREDLTDHGVIAWQRVARYWRESGTLAQIGGEPGAASCWATPGNRATDSDCRAFVVDTPWSAAFVSWIMTRAGIANFFRSPRHIDYIRAAWRDTTGAGPYRYADPTTEKPAPGDLLCFIRGRDQALGYAGLTAALAGPGPVPSESHCEIVVAANLGGDRTLHLIGGNVLNTVMMRALPLDRGGHVILPAPLTPIPDSGGALPPDRQCLPSQPDQCDFNRQDWAVLLQLRPQGVPVTEAPSGPEIPTAPAGGEPIRAAPVTPAETVTPP